MKREKALRKWQPRLRLADWRIGFAGPPPGDDDRSTVDVDVKVRSAVIRLRDDTPPSQVERQVVHELLHVVVSGMEDTYIGAKAYTPKAWDEQGDRSWDRACEFAIESLTDALTGSRRADWGPSEEPWKTAFPAEESA
jgi:hypothetical protein